jgi:PAS domain S-box-containing protein
MNNYNKSNKELSDYQILQEKYDALNQRYQKHLMDSRHFNEAIQRSEERYHQLAEQIDAVVWRFDLKNDKWVYVSPQADRILGYSPEEWTNNQFWVDIMHPDDQSWAPSFCLTETKRGAWHEFEYRLQHKKGEYVWIYDKVSVEKVDGEPVFLYGVMFDITRHKIDEEGQFNYALLKLKTAIENTEASVIITDKEGSIEYANPFFTKVTGYTPEEYIGQTPRILKSNIQSREHYQKLWETIKAGETWVGEFCNLNKNGEAFWEFATISPVKDELGEITHFVGVKTDISPLKKINEQLKEAKDEAEASNIRFQALHNATFGGIAIHDKGTILDCNKGLSDMTGYTREELLGMNGLLLIAEDYRDLAMSNIVAGIDKSYEVKGLRKSGEEYSLRVEGRNIPYKGKAVRVAEFRDITERKRSEQIIKKQNQELQDLNADKDRFITILAHDLKSPFSGLLGFAKMLSQNSKTFDASKIAEFTDNIFESAQGIYNLLEDLLAWMLVQSGKTSFKPEDIQLNNICDDITEIIEISARSKGVEVYCLFDKQLVVFADKEMLKTVLRNLMSNAVKYTNSGGKVVIYAVPEDDKVVIRVSDNGVGINPDKLIRMFNGTQPQSEPGTNNETGTGFGLLISRKFIEKHGGNIWAESKVGEGSDFFFSLPNRHS